MHVRMADEAVLLGPPPASESYLQMEKILEIAKITGSQAVHPGYGFLSENSKFATACEEAGIAFIGPPASSIVSMGDKSESKSIMLAAGVPCVPGYHGDNQDAKFLEEKANEIGFPLLVKAVLGGGGKGMKLVGSASEFAEQLSSAKREAMSAFGDDVVLLEKYITRPRHIELQVFGDKHGNCVHLFERDCSIQRRYQKVLEEAPAPGLTPEMRHKMGSSAVDAAKAVNYVGAGTVEFIFDRDSDAYYFMEMNTRLQVEHPVTEMVTKQDLVEWQLKVAAGYPLPMQQKELDEMGPQGHAFEARIYAEDPEKGFIPQTGQIKQMRLPEGEGVRVDTGIRDGDSVKPYYDPMISKLIVWDVNRTEALRKLYRALEDYQIVGLNNNIPFLLRCAQHRAFREADLDTGFIAKYDKELFPSKTADHEDSAGHILAALTTVLYKINGESIIETESPFGTSNAGFRVNTADTEAAPSLVVQLKNGDSDAVDVSVSVLSYDTFRFRLPDGTACMVQGRINEDGKLTAIVNEVSTQFSAFYEGSRVDLFWGSERRSFDVLPPAWAAAGETAYGKGSLLSPMPGRITKILANVGDQVQAGDPVLTLEAMKMEHIVRAPEKGTVKAINYNIGDLCEGNAELATVTASEEK